MNRLSVRLGVVGVVSLLAVSADLMPTESLMSPAEARSRTPVRRTTSSSDTGILASASRELASIARQATPSVVHIQSAHRSESGGMLEETGSGVIVSGMAVAGTYVITNRHVIVGAVPSGIEIHLSDGRVLRPVRIWVDDASDVGVMKIEEQGLQPAAWGDSSTLEIGDLVVALGSPFGLSQSVTLGIISAKGRRSLRLGKGTAVLNQNFLQTDAAINPGNSGGPLVDTSGRLIGINTAIASSSGGNDGIGFSIPSNLARHIADQLLQKGHVQRAYLGVKLDPDFNIVSARSLKLDRPRGARVLEVYASTPAALADLQLDDVVLKFDGTEVQDENHLINLVSLTPVGSRITLSILRRGRLQTLQVHLADRAELERRSQKAREQKSNSSSLRRIPRTPARPMSLSSRKSGPAAEEQITEEQITAEQNPAEQLLAGLRTTEMTAELARQLLPAARAGHAAGESSRYQSGLLILGTSPLTGAAGTDATVSGSLTDLVAAGDILIRAGGREIHHREDLAGALRAAMSESAGTLLLELARPRDGQLVRELAVLRFSPPEL